MSVFYGDFQWKLMKHITSLLKEDAYLKRMVGGRVYPQHLSTIDNPAFPAITISRVGQGADPGIQQINYAVISVDIWSKKGVSEMWKIYADHDVTNNRQVGVRSLLADKPQNFPEVLVHRIYESMLIDDLYEHWSKTWHLHAQFTISCAAKNVE